MKKLKFSTIINASRQKVWRTMLEKETYKIWTSAFSEGSKYEGSWEKGSKIKFVDSTGEGGMSAVIEDNVPYEFVSIKHLGYIKDGVEDFDSPEVKSWAPAFENYTFSDIDNGTKTEVFVEMDSMDEYADMFEEMWPKALAKLKEIGELPTKTITIEATIDAPVEKVWEGWNEPEHIKNWAFASDDWGVGEVENNLKVNGEFRTEMAAKDGSASFDFAGVYTDIELYKSIKYTMTDDRKVDIKFESLDGKTKIVETFEMENENGEELQRNGWQAILENFKKYVEGQV